MELIELTKEKKRIHELTALLNEASKAYYTNNEIMSDHEYDALIDELSKLEDGTGFSLPDSPTKKVGYEIYDVVGSLKKVKHESKMLSLDKTKDVEKLQDFLAENTGLLSWKLDGLTVALTYENGTLQQAVTRGNGEIGEDITHNAKVFKNLPKTIQFEGKLILRGEAVISYSDFEEINADPYLQEKYKNPRNLCVGTVRQLDSEICARRNVRFFAFSLVKADDVEFHGLKSNQLLFLENQGFQVTQYKKVKSETVVNEIALFSDEIKHNDYASDGLVLTYDDIEYSRSLGATSKFPKDSIAFKWADETSETTLIDVDWNTSRTGLLNPIAIFEPVELEGTTVNKASLHNARIFELLNLGKGDIITVYKANMIIPQVLDNLTRSGTLLIPEYCSVCSGKTEIVETNDAKFLYCRNPNCRAQQLSTLSHFTSRDAMNIEGFSQKSIEKFLDKGFLTNYSDIYSLEKYLDEILKMEGFGKRSVENLLNSIEQSKTRELHHFIYALGISHVGLRNAKLFCRHFGYDLEKIILASHDEIIFKEELLKIDGFSEMTASSITNYFNSVVNMKIMNNTLNKLNLKKPEISTKKLEGKTFVITGDVHVFKNRAELQKEIEENGGKVSNTVSNKTSFLINNDNLSQSAKNKKAIKLNIPIITEEMFLDMINFLNNKII